MIAHDISNHPKIGCKRKATVISFLDQREMQEIKIEVKVFYLSGLDEPLDEFIAPKIVPLRATMFEFVDANGNSVSSEDGIPEYVYWKNVISSGAIDEESLYALVIQKADSENKFD